MNLHCRVNNDDLENQITFDPKRYLVSQEMGNRLKIRWFSMSRRCPAIFFSDRKTTKNVLARRNIENEPVKMDECYLHSARGIEKVN